MAKKSTGSTKKGAKSSTAELAQVAENLRGKKSNKRKGSQQQQQVRMLPPPGDPMAVAREFLRESGQSTDGAQTIHHWRGSWWFWRTSYWQEAEDRVTRSALYKYTERSVYMTPLGAVPWQPNRRKITDLLDALTAIAILSPYIDQPSWLDGRTAGTIVATANGLLDIERGVLYPHTPQFFNGVAVPFDYDPAAPQPEQWLGFLDKLWPKIDGKVRPEIDALGEWYGYVISGRLDLHKCLLMVGPTRGGKGIIARILGAMIGEKNVAGPTLSSLGGEFGLAPLLGKSLAVLSDTRSGRHNSATVVERLLSISGEDTLTVNRKYRDQWTGKLPCRLHIVSNELPKLDDASSAIIGRMVMLLLTQTWLGQEDHYLEGKLRDELPGILNWALQGLSRLTITNKNRFTPITTTDEAIRQMRDLASPVRAFVREECQLGPDKGQPYEIDVEHLYGNFKIWCENAGHMKCNKQIFGRDLRAAFPAIGMTRTNTTQVNKLTGKAIRHRVYIGVRLRPADENEDDDT